MAVTPSSMLPLGTPLPYFALVDVVSGQTVSSASLAGSVAVVAFICNHCPFVVHIKPALSDFGRYCKERGVPLLAISANDVTTHPMDGPAAMGEDARRQGYVFPYLFDESQRVARDYGAEVTPDVFVFDAGGLLRWRGAPDADYNDASLGAAWLREALDAVLAGEEPDPATRDVKGCTIKWR